MRHAILSLTTTPVRLDFMAEPLRQLSPAEDMMEIVEKCERETKATQGLVMRHLKDRVKENGRQPAAAPKPATA